MSVDFINETATVKREEVKPIIFDFVDTLLKIRNIDKVDSVYFSKEQDVYVFTKDEDLNLEDIIIEKFAQWEMDYKIFPELHVLTKDQKYLLPEGAMGF